MDDLHDQFERATAGFASAAKSLPKDYLGENAERLLLVAEELRKSFGVQLKLVRVVSDLDVSDLNKVQALASHLKWYVDGRFFDNERTHCHNIDRLMALMVRRYKTGSPEDDLRIAAFDELVAPLKVADNDILDSLEPLAEDARDTVAAIEDAVGLQEQAPTRDRARPEELRRGFIDRAQNRVAKARKGLGELSRLSAELIDLASGLTPVRVDKRPR
jgi:hypothetical protein